jgi:uncharacterized protein (TIGR02145 family)
MNLPKAKLLLISCFFYIGLKAQIVKDIDGNIYHTVKIGKQTWMVENLKTTKFQNGNSIPKENNTVSWNNLTSSAYCDYENSVDSKTYGRLYNWYAVKDSRKIEPKGWHVASDAEWTILINYIGGENVAGGKLKEKGEAHWEYNNTETSNQTGFTSLPGGSIDKPGRHGIKDFGFWWTSTEENKVNAYYRTMNGTGINIYRSSYFKYGGFSVRCIKD